LSKSCIRFSDSSAVSFIRSGRRPFRLTFDLRIFAMVFTLSESIQHIVRRAIEKKERLGEAKALMIIGLAIASYFFAFFSGFALASGGG
jgi:hypothetical protein